MTEDIIDIDDIEDVEEEHDLMRDKEAAPTKMMSISDIKVGPGIICDGCKGYFRTLNVMKDKKRLCAECLNKAPPEYQPYQHQQQQYRRFK